MTGLPDPLNSSDALRAHLLRAGEFDLTYGPVSDQSAADMAPIGEATLKAASVLIGIIERADGLHLVLTKRTAHLSAHAGQISFPGGRAEVEDATPADTALREAHEEIGLPPASVDVLGSLSFYVTVTGFQVSPIVGWIKQPVHYVIDPNEVDEVFEVPLSFVIDQSNHRREFRMRNNEKRYFFAIPYGERYIWGATAGMLVGFARLLHTDFDALDEPDKQ